jgi:hypothetical protein
MVKAMFFEDNVTLDLNSYYVESGRKKKTDYENDENVMI